MGTTTQSALKLGHIVNLLSRKCLPSWYFSKSFHFAKRVLATDLMSSASPIVTVSNPQRIRIDRGKLVSLFYFLPVTFINPYRMNSINFFRKKTRSICIRNMA